MSDTAPDQATEALPARTTPTWEMEVLLSGATVFALFQVYGEINVFWFDLLERLPKDSASMWAPLGIYVQGGVLGLALGFLVHLLLRAVWVALVGLHSIDPEGGLRRNENLGPAQRKMLGETLDALPQRIGQLDDAATSVFGLAIGLAKLMAGMVLIAGVGMLAGLIASLLSSGRIDSGTGFLITISLWIAPLMLVTLYDNHLGKKARHAPGWVSRVLRVYQAMGMTADRNLGMTMATYRLAGPQRSIRGSLLVGLTVTAIILIVLVAPVLQHRGLGRLLMGELPRLNAGDSAALRDVHYLDRLPPDAVLRLPALPSEVASGPYLRLFIPYAPEDHDLELQRCRESLAIADKPKATDGTDHAPLLSCLACTQPIQLNGVPIEAPWLLSNDSRHERHGFTVMIDIRQLAPGAHVLTVTQPADPSADTPERALWRLPFWN